MITERPRPPDRTQACKRIELEVRGLKRGDALSRAGPAAQASATANPVAESYLGVALGCRLESSLRSRTG